MKEELPYPNLTPKEERMIDDSKKSNGSKKSNFKFNKLKSPKISGKITYKKTNPLSKILSHKKSIVKVGGY